MKRIPILAAPAPPWRKSNRDGSPWWTRVFRITTTRIVSQAFFFGLFFFGFGRIIVSGGSWAGTFSSARSRFNSASRSFWTSA